MLSRKQRDPGFSLVSLVFGDFPDLPFLANVYWVDFRDPSRGAYRRAFYRLLCGLGDHRRNRNGSWEANWTSPNRSAPSAGNRNCSSNGLLLYPHRRRFSSLGMLFSYRA